MTVSVYLAGSGDPRESVRVAWAVKQIHECDGLTLAHDWAATIKQYGRNPKDVSIEQRRAWAVGDLEAVRKAEVFWLLLPRTASVGAWVELGAAYGSDRRIIVSGDDPGSVFVGLADGHFERDLQALEWLVRYSRLSLHERLGVG